MSKVYVLVYPDTRNLENQSFEYRAWAGLSLILDVLRRQGYEIGYTDAAGASGKVVLATVPSAVSWYALVDAWTRACPTHATLIVGGSGVLNVRPFLALTGAVFVLGRGETLISSVVEAALAGDYVESPHVIYPARFSFGGAYQVCQGAGNYPHPVRLQNGKVWREVGQGCPFRCYFCNYTWTRSLPRAVDYGRQINDRDAVVAGAVNLQEHNLCDLLKAWRKGQRLGSGGMVNCAIDGQSERIRRAVKKPVTRAMLRQVGEWAPQNMVLSLMTVVGFPGETAEDRAEAIGDLAEGLLRRPGTARWGIEVSPNSFRPMPCTPLAWAPTQVKDWHNELLREWRAGYGAHPMRLWTDPDGRRGIKMGWGTGGAWRQIVDLIVHRGTERDWPAIVKMARADRFWRASPQVKEATLHRYFNVGRLADQFDLVTLPTRYLHGRLPNAELFKMGQVALAQLTGFVDEAPQDLGVKLGADDLAPQ